MSKIHGQNPQFGAPSTTGNFNNWAVWQYSHTGTSGGISPLDLDVIHSEYKPLSALVIVAEPATTLAAAVLTLASACLGRRRPR